MLEAARGWLTPGVLFVLVNLVVATIAVASRLMSPPPNDGPAGERPRGLMRAPSFAVDRLRSTFSFSRLGLAADHAPLFDAAAAVGVVQDEPAATETRAPPPETEREANHGWGGEEEAARIERAPPEGGTAEKKPRQLPRGRKMRRAATEEEPALARVATAAVPEAREAAAGRRRGEEPAVEVDARADDFINRFREQLRMQRLDSILRYRDTLRRTGTA